MKYARFESFESRQLLSAVVGEAKLDHATLNVRGPEKVGSAITVTQDTTAHTLTVSIVTNAATPLTFSQTFDATGVTLVKVRGGKYADTIKLVNVDGVTPFSLNSRVDGDKGDDMIITGSGNDRIDAGEGNDTVYSDAGNDALWGGKGNDELHAGDGNDVVMGGNGDDALDGGGGNDRIFSLLGKDNVRGGSGEDTFVVRKGHKAHIKDAGKHDHNKQMPTSGSEADDAPPAA